MMTWVYTDSEDLTDRWSPEDFEQYTLTVSISCIEWFNVDTGATYCLVSNGVWETGGKFHLLFKAPCSDPAIDVSVMIDSKFPYYGPDTSANNYRKSRGAVVEFINKILPATNVLDFDVE